MRHIILVFLILFAFTECKKKKTVDQAALDEEIIAKYIADNNLNAKATGSGLYYVIKTPGTGKQPSAASSVKVVYRGYLTSGDVFDQSKAAGYSTSLSQVIKGWQEGIPYFKEGGKGMLLIPSALGYGGQAMPGIPENSVLIFDIELLDVN